MDNLFVKTMLKLQENRKTVRKNRVLKEDINDDIKNIEDVDGFEKDVVTVVDPDLSTEEFNDKQDEINKLIDETPEGEKVVNTEYVGQHIYTCPLCLTNFYSETEMGEEQKCPVCFETPTEFIYLGTVEQDLNDEDKEALDNAEKEMDSTEPAEGQEEIPEEGGEEPAPISTPEEGEEVSTEEPAEEEEEGTLTASKKVSTKGSVLGENLTEDEEGSLKPLAVLSLTNSMSLEIVEIDTNEDEVKYRYNYGDGRYSDVEEAALEYDEEGRPFFKDYKDEDGNSQEWYIDEFMRTDFGESLKTESKNLNENLQVGGSLFFKVKNDIIETQITNIYVDDFNNKTYVQYSNPEGKRSGTLDSEEILKGLEEGTITSENPVPAEEKVEVPAVAAETAEEEPVENVGESKEVQDALDKGMDKWNERGPIDVAGVKMTQAEFDELEMINDMLEKGQSIDNMRLSDPVKEVLKKFELI